MAHAQVDYKAADGTLTPAHGEVEVAYGTLAEKERAEALVAQGVLSWERRAANPKKPRRGRS